MSEQVDGMEELLMFRVAGPEAEIYGRLRLGLTDFARVTATVDHIQECSADVETNAALIMALYESALVTYVRAFHSCRAKGLMSERTIFNALGEGGLALHRYYLDMRNQHIAHNDSEHEVSLVGVALVPGDDAMGELGVVSFDLRRMFDEPSSIRQLAGLSGALSAHLTALEPVHAEAVRAVARVLGRDGLGEPGIQWTAPEPKVSGTSPREK